MRAIEERLVEDENERLAVGNDRFRRVRELPLATPT